MKIDTNQMVSISEANQNFTISPCGIGTGVL